MPLNISDNLPAVKILEEENIFVMKHTRAVSQDIRPLKILLLNQCPQNNHETQLLRLLSNTLLQVEVTLFTQRCTYPKHP